MYGKASVVGIVTATVVVKIGDGVVVVVGVVVVLPPSVLTNTTMMVTIVAPINTEPPNKSHFRFREPSRLIELVEVIQNRLEKFLEK